MQTSELMPSLQKIWLNAADKIFIGEPSAGDLAKSAILLTPT